ncbi:MAG: tetratricopeptide repeat protein [Meiothermus sp.]|uniref:tetratricopeptide repeat protein n=1 Tax=Meiothermus sp. TaxID=1955249 RepID=UPI0025ED0F0C|nr:tetratricopeptide repeat protein [Meiothermus sp.]MCS7069361.1 tetratricopeptide repeat protein [Meiothermus sp.]MCX7601297.1 tetratricopeptide repeat protein [Meiothermus sp.]MDW8426243.1 tetratricopeptide repeat protein [Meiothermus sp.]
MEELDQLIRLGRYEEARSRILAGEEGDADGLAVLLELRDWLRLKEYGRAQKLLEQDGDLIAGYLDVAQARVAIEAFDQEDEGRITAYLEDPHLGAEAWAALGLVQIRSGRREEARQAFEAALKADPRHYRVRTNLANLTLEAGQTDEAIRMYEEVLKLNPDYALAHHNLGAAYRKKGLIDKSVYHIKRGQRLQMQPAARPPRSTGTGPSAPLPLPERRPFLGSLGNRWWLWLLAIVVVYWLLSRQP